MCEELRADLCQIKNEQKETQNQVYLLEATIRKLREDNFEAEMVQVELKSERDLALEQAKNAQVNILNIFKGSLKDPAILFSKSMSEKVGPDIERL